jgi:hypothetical protein
MKQLMIVVLSMMCGSAWADMTFHCPSPDSIQQHSIPSSINCAYSAVSDGIAFGGFNNCGLVGLPFVGGRVAETNGFWSIYCGYSNRKSVNTMSVGPDAVIASCAFANGTRSCRGSLLDCAVTCPSAPTIAGNAELKTKQ